MQHSKPDAERFYCISKIDDGIITVRFKISQGACRQKASKSLIYMNNPFPTDEDRMIYRLTVHRNMITWLLKQLESEDIQAQRTVGNEPNGDIVLINVKDVPRAQQLICKIQTQ